MFAVLLCLPWAFLAGMPPPSLGLWWQSEPVWIALHILGGILGLLLVVSPQKEVAPLLKRPVVLLPLALAAWSALSALLFMQNPLLSFLGAPETGEGILIFLDLSIYTLGYIYFFKVNPKLSKLLLINVLIAAVTVLVMAAGALWFQNQYAPYYFSDYTAFVALPMWITLSRLPCHFTLPGFQSPTIRWAYQIILYAFLVAVAWASDNKAALVLFLGAPIGAYILENVSVFKRKEALFWGVACLMIPVTITLIILFASQSDLVSGINRSIRSRYFLAVTAKDALLDHPKTIVTGYGWGKFPELQVNYFPRDEVTLTDEAGERWEGSWRHHFHSHNQLLETLLAAGLPGLALFLLYWFYFARTLRKEDGLRIKIFVLSFLSLWMLWFVMPLIWVFLAFSAAWLSRDTDALDMPQSLQKKLSRIPPLPLLAYGTVAALTSLGLLASAYYAYQLAYKSIRYDYVEYDEDAGTCPYPLQDKYIGGLHTGEIWRDYNATIKIIVGEIETDPAVGQPEPPRELTEGEKETKKNTRQVDTLRANTLNRYKYFQCVEQRMIEEGHASARLLAVGLITRTDMAFQLAPYFEDDLPVDDLLEEWEDNLRLFLSMAPSRTDQAVPYILWRLNRGEEAKAGDIITLIEQYAPTAPETLWFSGFMQLTDPDKAHEGLFKMRAALEKGIETVVPVEPDLKNLVYQQTEILKLQGIRPSF